MFESFFRKRKIIKSFGDPGHFLTAIVWVVPSQSRLTVPSHMIIDDEMIPGMKKDEALRCDRGEAVVRQ